MNEEKNEIKTKINKIYESLKILGLEADASPDEIRAAFREFAKIYHPDVAAPRDAWRFQQITGAYAVLKNFTPEYLEKLENDLKNDLDNDLENNGEKSENYNFENDFENDLENYNINIDDYEKNQSELGQLEREKYKRELELERKEREQKEKKEKKEREIRERAEKAERERKEREERINNILNRYEREINNYLSKKNQEAENAREQELKDIIIFRLNSSSQAVRNIALKRTGRLINRDDVRQTLINLIMRNEIDDETAKIIESLPMDADTRVRIASSVCEKSCKFPSSLIFKLLDLRNSENNNNFDAQLTERYILYANPENLTLILRYWPKKKTLSDTTLKNLLMSDDEKILVPVLSAMKQYFPNSAVKNQKRILELSEHSSPAVRAWCRMLKHDSP